MSRVRVPVPGPSARRRTTTIGWWLFVGTLGAGVLAAAALGVAGVGWLALAIVSAAATWLVLRIRPGVEGRAGYMVVREDTTPVEVPEGRLLEPVQACMRCGSLDLATPAIRDGVWPGGGELQFLVCRRCNTRAPPLTFDRAEDYAAFVRELHEPAADPSHA